MSMSGEHDGRTNNTSKIKGTIRTNKLCIIGYFTLKLFPEFFKP